MKDAVLRIVAEDFGDGWYPNTVYRYELYDFAGNLLASDDNKPTVNDYLEAHNDCRVLAIFEQDADDEESVTEVLEEIGVEPFTPETTTALTVEYGADGTDSGHMDTVISAFYVGYLSVDDVNAYLRLRKIGINYINDIEEDPHEISYDETAKQVVLVSTKVDGSGAYNFYDVNGAKLTKTALTSLTGDVDTWLQEQRAFIVYFATDSDKTGVHKTFRISQTDTLWVKFTKHGNISQCTAGAEYCASFKAVNKYLAKNHSAIFHIKRYVRREDDEE